MNKTDIAFFSVLMTARVYRLGRHGDYIFKNDIKNCSVRRGGKP